MGFPTSGYFATQPNSGAGQTALDNLVAAVKQLPGAQDETELTISSGSVTATRAMHTVDTESNAASDDLTNVDITGMDTFLLILRAENAARVVTLKHEQGGAGQLSLRGGQDAILDATSKYILFWLDTGASPTTLREVARFGFDAVGVVEANTAVAASPNVITEDEVGKTFTNEGATAANYHNLPSARAGLGPYRFVVQDADGMRINAAAGDTIRIDDNATPAAGYIESTTIGNVVALLAINDTEWFAVELVDDVPSTWTVST